MSDSLGSWVTPWGHEWLFGVLSDSLGSWGTLWGHEWLSGAWVTPWGHEWLSGEMSNSLRSWVTPWGHEWLTVVMSDSYTPERLTRTGYLCWYVQYHEKFKFLEILTKVEYILTQWSVGSTAEGRKSRETVSLKTPSYEIFTLQSRTMQHVPTPNVE